MQNRTCNGAKLFHHAAPPLGRVHGRAPVGGLSNEGFVRKSGIAEVDKFVQNARQRIAIEITIGTDIREYGLQAYRIWQFRLP